MRLLATATIAAWVLSDQAYGIAWQDEVNVSICNWAEFRANVIRDTIYVDGGDLWWEIGLSDGTYTGPESDDDVEGLMYTLNLGQPFNQSTNLTGLFGTLSKTGGQASNNIAPNYVDGVMFANNDELITYGGLMAETNSSSPPAADAILAYEAYKYSSTSETWSPGFDTETLPTNVTRYITNGAGVSAPSENMGYYFSGMRAADWGPIYDGDGSADTLANTLISVNMTVMRQETWTNDTLPSNIPARANAQLEWIPVGENGLLVAVGGVIDPASLTVEQGLNSSQTNASTEVSPTFMETVSIYDITNQEWYLQNTTGDIPPQLTLFCSVVAPAPDRSSFNIYIYGGYNGIDESSTPSDDVYILSVPQMVWTLAYNGTSDHGRSGHTCFRVYPDQMMVLGGVYEGSPEICLSGSHGGIIEVFNLNNLEFQDSYDPQVWEEYSVPDVVTDKIGGNGNGSATVLAPSSISSIFATEYTKPISTYYPYALVTANATSTSSSTASPTGIVIKTSGGLPAWVGPVLGVVLGLIVIAAAVIFYLLWRRRRSARGRSAGAGASEAPTTASGIKGFVLRWLYGTSPQEDKSQAPVGEDIDGATVVSSKTHERHISEAGSVGIQEMEGPGMPVFEMGSGGSNHAPNWSDMNWSQPQASPPLVSPNIDEMMYQSHFDNGLVSPAPIIVETGATTARRPQRYIRQPTELSTGHRSDGSNVSEIGSSDTGRPAHNRQASDNSVSDTISNPASQDGATSEVSSREQAVTVVSSMRDRIHTVHEIDELDGGHDIGPLDEYGNRRARQRNLTELE